jgi:hypothetical protein
MRYTNESISGRVVGYSAATIASLLVLCFIQVVYLKRFFQRKKLI